MPKGPNYARRGGARIMGRPTIGGLLLGVSLGGLFDGILLHQVLQWHHLLSLVQNQSVQDLRTQIMADGLFHILMYAIACGGLWLLWSSHRAGASAGPWRLIGVTLLGFGLWQFLDVVLFHWIMQIHRIRVDVENPLVWDVGWLIAFGVPALVAGVWILARARSEVPSDHGSMRRASAGLTSVILIAGLVSLLPTGGNAGTVAVFGSDATPAQVFQAVAAFGARIKWAHQSGTIVALDFGEGASRTPLYRSGAILVTGAVAPCIGWIKT